MIEEARSQLPVIDNHLKLFVLNSSRTFGEQVSLQLAVEPQHARGNVSSRMASIRRGH